MMHYTYILKIDLYTRTGGGVKFYFGSPRSSTRAAS